MAEAQKKVIVRPFDVPPVSGYLPAAGFVTASQIEMIDAHGKSISFNTNTIKLIAYVRDFNPREPLDPERLGRRSFPSRPRTEGLWMRMTFRDGETLEGLATADITLLDPLVTDHGLMVTPPDTRSNTQRVYIPRTALTSLELLGVISRRKPVPPREPQPWLFGDS